MAKLTAGCEIASQRRLKKNHKFKKCQKVASSDCLGLFGFFGFLAFLGTFRLIGIQFVVARFVVSGLFDVPVLFVFRATFPLFVRDFLMFRYVLTFPRFVCFTTLRYLTVPLLIFFPPLAT